MKKSLFLLRECIKAIIEESINPKDAEYSSIEAFAQFLMDDEREEYSHEDLAALNFRLRKPIALIRNELDTYGFKLATRPVEKHIRGFTTPSNDRWYGPGSIKSHGGAGIDNATGRATVKGKTV